MQVCAQSGAHSSHGSAGPRRAFPAAHRARLCGQAAAAWCAGAAGQPHAAHLTPYQPCRPSPSSGQPPQLSVRSRRGWCVLVQIKQPVWMLSVNYRPCLKYIEMVLAACSYSDQLTMCTRFFSDLHFVCSASSTAGYVLARLPRHLQCKSNPAALSCWGERSQLLSTVNMLPMICRSTKRGSRLKTTQQW